MKNQIRFVEVFAVLAIVVGASWSAPVNAEGEDGPDLTSAYLEDDMIIDFKRNGVPANQSWPNGIVYYNITGNYNAPRLQYIRDAMDAIEAVTCVRFRQARKNRKVFLRITALAKGCYASVGYNGKDATLNLQKHDLDTGCFRRGILIHELMHTLGFRHQHSAHDRDQFIVIKDENIIPEKKWFFQKFNETDVTDFGFGYDYYSVLHYRRNAFSVNGDDTIVPLDPTVRIGQRDGLSVKDIGKINAMYNCTV